MRSKIAAFVLIGATALLAPARGDAEIPRTEKQPYAAPRGQALLIFKRPRERQASETDFRIVDQGGRCLAMLRNDWQVAAPVWPGKQMLLIITGTAPPTVQLLEAKVSGGKTYLVELRARVNVKRPVDIEVIRRADQPLEAFPPEVREQSPFQEDLRKCTEWVSWKRPRIEPKAEIAKSEWDDASEEQRAAHTIRRNDGWRADEIYGP